MGDNRTARPAARLTVLSGPSGTGRHRVAELARARSSARWRPVPVTTRPRRADEVDGVDYRFVSRSEFDALLRAGDLLEWAEVGGDRYGTPRSPVESRLRRGEPVLVSLDLPGARQVRQAVPEAVSVLLVHPDAVTDGHRQARAAGWEYDATVVNDLIERAVAELVGLLGPSAPR
ncbi:MAG TPA: guanylate kinase [Natronosporangium sp.]|nr:guanylate kinase [Natronosporangium sp.]